MRAVSAQNVAPAATGAAARRQLAPRDVAAPLRLRVLQVVPALGLGGTEQALLNMVAGLDEDRFECRFCAINGCDTAWPRVQALAGRISVLARDARPPLFAMPSLVKLIRAYRPHIVHSRNWGAIEAVPAARLAGVPVVIHSEHGYEMDILAGLPLRRRLYRRLVYPMAHTVFTVTRELRDYHARQAWTSPDNLQVIYNGVDTERFRPQPDIRERVRLNAGLPADAFVAGSVGRLVPIKDHLTLLKAAEMVRRQGINVWVLLVGDGPEHARLADYVRQSPLLAGHVVLTGQRHDIPELLNAIDAFVLPSISEGMSNTVLEAMASGVPVVATAVGGNPELLNPDFSEWLFPAGDVGALASRLQKLAGSSATCSQLGRLARRRVVERFTLERMHQQYCQMYLELATRQRVPNAG